MLQIGGSIAAGTISAVALSGGSVSANTIQLPPTSAGPFQCTRDGKQTKFYTKE